MKDRLIELIQQSVNGCARNWAEVIAECLLANGVIVRDDSDHCVDVNKMVQNQWVSVEDGLPKNGLARVLVFLRDDEYTKNIGFNKIDTDRCVNGEWVRWGRHVTHWMGLPAPPKIKKE